MQNTPVWSTNTSTLHPLIAAYTVGDDVVYDQKLLGYDIRATKAHCHMLASVGLLTQTEATQLSNALDALRHAWEAGEFTVTDEYEDGHSAIEAYLTDALGTVGKKVHTARSRNDQALVMMRLYLKDMLAKTSAQLDHLADAFVAQAHTHQTTPMPGYTHTQKAMPTTVGAWLGSFGDALHDQAQYLTTIVPVIDQNPLGSAAGFGVSLPLDRAVTTRELGFAKTQHNPMYCGLSRGIFELMAVQALVPSMTIAGKFATDMLLFTAQEYGFFGLPASLTTGSSIMPHKHNYDVFEIVRANAHSFGQYTLQLQTVAGGVGSGYHRDLQLTKKPTVDAFTLALATLEVLQLVVSELVVYPAALKRAMTDELLSVQRINELVATGVPFRDAYHQVKQTLTKTHQ